MGVLYLSSIGKMLSHVYLEIFIHKLFQWIPRGSGEKARIPEVAPFITHYNIRECTKGVLI